jgi:hypothetical protein
MMSDTVERSLEGALQEAKSELAAAELQRAAWELKVQALHTEIVGVEAALKRKRIATSPPLRPNPTPGSGLTPTWDSQLVPTTPAAAGVAALVLLLVDVHKNWTTKKRAAAVESVLKVAGRPVHRSEVTEALKRLGRTGDTLEYVSAALAYLNREGRARPTGDGYWIFCNRDSENKGGETRD